MQQSQHLKVALEAVKAAEEIILHYFKSNLAVDSKQDKTPVTVADREAEQKIKEVILKHFPDHGFLGEEFGKEAESAEYKWIIDPIDGTKNFVREMPFFCTQLGLMRGGEFLLGVANWAAQGNLMFAEKNSGAYLNNQPIHVSETNTLEESYFSHGGIKYFGDDNQLQKAFSLSKTTRFSRGWGAELGQFYLPTGQIDIHVDEWIRLWDISAFIVILEEAGGKITDIKGNPITVDTTAIIATNSLLHDQIVEHFNS